MGSTFEEATFVASLRDAIMAVDDMEIITRLDAADDIDGNEGSGDSSSEEDEGLDDE